MKKKYSNSEGNVAVGDPISTQNVNEQIIQCDGYDKYMKKLQKQKRDAEKVARKYQEKLSPNDFISFVKSFEENNEKLKKIECILATKCGPFPLFSKYYYNSISHSIGKVSFEPSWYIKYCDIKYKPRRNANTLEDEYIKCLKFTYYHELAHHQFRLFTDKSCGDRNSVFYHYINEYFADLKAAQFMQLNGEEAKALMATLIKKYYGSSDISCTHPTDKMRLRRISTGVFNEDTIRKIADEVNHKFLSYGRKISDDDVNDILKKIDKFNKKHDDVTVFFNL